MPTVERFRGFPIMVFVDDHPPPHVHAEGHGNHAAFLLGTDPGDVELRGTTRLPLSEVAALRRFVAVKRDILAQAWEELHGDE